VPRIAGRLRTRALSLRRRSWRAEAPPWLLSKLSANGLFILLPCTALVAVSAKRVTVVTAVTRQLGDVSAAIVGFSRSRRLRFGPMTCPSHTCPLAGAFHCGLDQTEDVMEEGTRSLSFRRLRNSRTRVVLTRRLLSALDSCLPNVMVSSSSETPLPFPKTPLPHDETLFPSRQSSGP
jgi:hypothetical protein